MAFGSLSKSATSAKPRTYWDLLFQLNDLNSQLLTFSTLVMKPGVGCTAAAGAEETFAFGSRGPEFFFSSDSIDELFSYSARCWSICLSNLRMLSLSKSALKGVSCLSSISLLSFFSSLLALESLISLPRFLT